MIVQPAQSVAALTYANVAGVIYPALAVASLTNSPSLIS